MFGLGLRGLDQRLDVGGREVRVRHDRERRGRDEADRRHVLERIEAEIRIEKRVGDVAGQDHHQRLTVGLRGDERGGRGRAVRAGAVLDRRSARRAPSRDRPRCRARSCRRCRRARKPTSQRIGPDGQVCARPLPASATHKVSAAITRAFIVSSRLFPRSLQISAESATRSDARKSGTGFPQVWRTHRDEARTSRRPP